MSALAREQFAEHVVELMQCIGPVNSKRMFGGHGIFLEGLMFALIADNELYLKVDGDSKRSFEEKGLQPFEYNKSGKLVKMSYYQAPEEVLEDQEQMRLWANRAYEAAVEAAVRKRP